MGLAFFRRAKREIGIFWLSPDVAAGATFSGGVTRPVDLRNSSAPVAVLSDVADETAIRAWAIENRVEVGRILPRSELLRAVHERFLTEKNALIVGSVSGRFFIGLFREGQLVFDYGSADGTAELEKALKSCLRQSRGSTQSYVIADSPDAFEKLSALVQATTGSGPIRLAGGPEALELLAGAAAPQVAERVSRYSVAAIVVGFIVLAATGATDYALRGRLAELEGRRQVLEARSAAVMAKAVELEKVVDGGNLLRAASPKSNVPETKEILLFLSRAMPAGITVEELTADGGSAGQTAPYEGIRSNVGSPAPAGPRFLVRGTASDLDSFSKVIRAFKSSAWRLENVQKMDEIGAVDPVGARYEFLIAVRREAAS